MTGFQIPFNNCWKWKLNRNDSNEDDFWGNLNCMVKVDIKSHFAMKREKESITDYDYNHTVRISIKDYWNDIDDYWDVNFVSKCRKLNNNNNHDIDDLFFVSRYDSAIIWRWT